MIRVKGGGVIHAVHVNIETEDLIVDDLGEIIGDLHSITCGSSFSGTDGAAGTGNDISLWHTLRN